MDNKQLIIAGFHRSGTSMVAELFHAAGVFLGWDLLGTDESNPHGHFEDWDFIKYHDRLLKSAGSNWKDENAKVPFVSSENYAEALELVNTRNLNKRVWGFKDPRVCLFLKLWNNLMPDGKVLIVYRHYVQSLSSIYKRHAVNLIHDKGPINFNFDFFEEAEKGLKLWALYNEHLVEFAKNNKENCFVVSHDAIMNGYPLVQKLNDLFQLNLTGATSSESIDPTLINTENPLITVSPELMDRIKSIWQNLNNLSTSYDPEATSKLPIINLSEKNTNTNTDVEIMNYINELSFKYGKIKNIEYE